MARTASTVNVPDRNDKLTSEREKRIRGATPEEEKKNEEVELEAR